MGAPHQAQHDWLFNRYGIGVPGAKLALHGPVPKQTEYSDAAAQEYAAISLDVLKRTFQDPRLRGRDETALVSASGRLLILERIVLDRGLRMPSGMPEMLARVKTIPFVIARLGLRSIG